MNRYDVWDKSCFCSWLAPPIVLEGSNKPSDFGSVIDILDKSCRKAVDFFFDRSTRSCFAGEYCKWWFVGGSEQKVYSKPIFRIVPEIVH